MSLCVFMLLTVVPQGFVRYASSGCVEKLTAAGYGVEKLQLKVLTEGVTFTAVSGECCLSD